MSVEAEGTQMAGNRGALQRGESSIGAIEGYWRPMRFPATMRRDARREARPGRLGKLGVVGSACIARPGHAAIRHGGADAAAGGRRR